MNNRFFKAVTSASAASVSGTFTYLYAKNHQDKYDEVRRNNPGKAVNCRWQNLSSYGGYYTYDVVDSTPTENNLQKRC